MIEIIPTLVILFAHWIADFIFQTDEMAKNKSTSNMWLAKHILSYMLGLFLVLCLAIPLAELIPWILVNGVLHFVIDYCTSRISSKLYAKGDIHNFFVVIGFDQFLHAVSLLITFQIMIKG